MEQGVTRGDAKMMDLKATAVEGWVATVAVGQRLPSGIFRV